LIILKKILIIVLLLSFISCDKTLDIFNGGINNVTVGYDGVTSFNPPVKPVDSSVVPSKAITPSAKIPAKSSAPTIKEQSTFPSLPGTQTPTQPSVPTSSILDGLPPLTKSFFLTERESIGMPRVNGERIEADLYGSDILIIKYSTQLIKIRYSQDIKNIDKLGQVEGENARIAYPASFVKIFFQDANGDTSVKIFGIVQNSDD